MMMVATDEICNWYPCAMNEYNGSDGKVPFILKIKTIWKWSALNSNCFVHWARDLIPNEQEEGNPTKLVKTTETDTLPFNIIKPYVYSGITVQK